MLWSLESNDVYPRLPKLQPRGLSLSASTVRYVGLYLEGTLLSLYQTQVVAFLILDTNFFFYKVITSWQGKFVSLPF